VVSGRSLGWGLLLLGALLAIRPVVSNAAFLKNDPLALLCAVAAVLAISRARRSGPALLAAAVLCSLAIFSKQSYLAAPLACAGFLACHDRRRAAVFATSVTVMVGLATLSVWGDGFRFSVLQAMRNPMSWPQMTGQWRSMLVQPAFVAMALAGLAALAVTASAPDRLERLRRSPYALYALAALAVLLVTLPKAGSSTNYFIEPTLALLLVLADWGRRRLARPADTGLPPAVAVAALGLAAAGALELSSAPRESYSFTNQPASARAEEQLRALSESIEALCPPEPLLLNLYGANLSHPLPGTVHVSDPLLYFLLWETGALSPDPLVAALSAQRYDGVLAHRNLPTAGVPAPVAGLQHALAQRYRPALDFGELIVLVPDR
jgi:hypothetical protein